MPVLGYCLSVGSVLLTLMFVADVYLPSQPPLAEAHRTYKIPIKAKHVGPQPLTFSGATRTFGPPPASLAIVDLAGQTNPSKQADAKPADPRQAHAQMTNASQAVEPKAKPARKKIARRKVYRDRDVAQVPEPWRQNGGFGFAFARPLW
ncbi:hypothetical protein [Bradyrhizobium sp. LHD-71]|uniref:hypothetical protein n=1 Tax=Bradyrhizobium sp. LHD-71 TaxID=3072141 RepID=UPI00280E0B16|nr:hypothetical protein [Bradyrhizobium sp. LHD-71]MDQ8732135.1 hypothetical protein [Bradyrhizobium sp. LHD-71]